MAHATPLSLRSTAGLNFCPAFPAGCWGERRGGAGSAAGGERGEHAHAEGEQGSKSIWRRTSHILPHSMTPYPENMQAAGENAEEELAALLEESGASMHTQKESRAEKAAWWRTRIALDARLQHLCAALQKRLGPWL